MSDDAGEAVAVRVARPDDLDAVRNLLDAAMLTVPDDLPARVAADDALVAVERAVDVSDDQGDGDRGSDRERDAGGSPIGTLVLDGSRIDAVAVNRSRRDEGIGSALVRAATGRTDAPLTATFRPQVRPFYESLGFDVEEADPDDPESDRLRGRREPETEPAER